MKRLLALLLSLVMLLTLIPAAAAEDIEIIEVEEEPVGVGAPGGPITVFESEEAAEPDATLATGMCGAEYYDASGILRRYDVWWTLTTDGVLTISGTGKMGWTSEFSSDPPWSDYRANITSVEIKSGVTTIANRAFYSCSRLKNVSIPASIVAIGNAAFSGCVALKSVNLPDRITSISGFCFECCSSLTSVNVPVGLTSIGYYAFSGCTSLTSITLPASLTTIGEHAFASCSALAEVTIPASVTEIGDRAFYNCSSLTAIKVSSANNTYASSSGVLFNKEKTLLICYPCGKCGNYTIPNTVYAIIPSAFTQCKKLGKITIGSNVVAIPERCFEYAVLTDIVIPSSVEVIDNMSFEWTKGFSCITIPASVESIGGGAFAYNLDLKTVYFSGDAPIIDDSAFSMLNISVYYPADAKGWGEAMLNDYGASSIDWLPCEQPSVTTQPKKTTAYPGETVNFKVAANTNVAYQWYYRKNADSAWTKCSGDSATTDTLQISVKSYHNGYQYRCKMTNPLGSVTSHYASLTVSAPKITTQPADKTTTIGATASFTVKASGASSYQWQFSKDGGATWSNCSNGTSASLSVTVKNYHHGYQYRCKVTNAIGTVCSDAATLSLSKPTVTKDPKTVSASPDETVTFTVTAGNAASYQWYFRKTETGSWSKCSNGTSASLTVEAKSYRHGYQYRCAVKNAAGTVYSNAATLRVKPGITTQPTDKTASSGETVTFTVKATGATGYQWYYRKTPTGAWNKCTDGTSATLTVEAKSYRSGFQYRCKVTNEVGSVYTDAVTLTVK